MTITNQCKNGQLPRMLMGCKTCCIAASNRKIPTGSMMSADSIAASRYFARMASAEGRSFIRISRSGPRISYFSRGNGFDWKGQQDRYFELAKHAIGYGVVDAWLQDSDGNIPYIKTPTISSKAVNNGLSNISARTARLDPRWEVSKPDNSTNPRMNK